jgi:hypothetical protein
MSPHQKNGEGGEGGRTFFLNKKIPPKTARTGLAQALVAVILLPKEDCQAPREHEPHCLFVHGDRALDQAVWPLELAHCGIPEGGQVNAGQGKAKA